MDDYESIPNHYGDRMWTFFLLMACRPSIQLKITHPADVTIDPSVTKIAVVDKVSMIYKGCCTRILRAVSRSRPGSFSSGVGSADLQ